MPSQPNNPSVSDLGDGAKQLTLVKGDQRWVFRYTPGEEASLMTMLAEAAGDTSSSFDWFDAAVLSHQMGEVMQQRLEEIAEQTPPNDEST